MPRMSTKGSKEDSVPSSVDRTTTPSPAASASPSAAASAAGSTNLSNEFENITSAAKEDYQNRTLRSGKQRGETPSSTNNTSKRKRARGAGVSRMETHEEDDESNSDDEGRKKKKVDDSTNGGGDDNVSTNNRGGDDNDSTNGGGNGSGVEKVRAPRIKTSDRWQKKFRPTPFDARNAEGELFFFVFYDKVGLLTIVRMLTIVSMRTIC